MNPVLKNDIHNFVGLCEYYKAIGKITRNNS